MEPAISALLRPAPAIPLGVLHPRWAPGTSAAASLVRPRLATMKLPQTGLRSGTAQEVVSPKNVARCAEPVEVETPRSQSADTSKLLGPALWRASEQAQVRTEATGYPELDKVLPGGGWPIGAVSEILHPRIGVGELSLTLPLMARLTQSGHPVALIAPPLSPHAPRLAASGVQLEQLLVIDKPADDDDALWSAELLLRGGAGAVLLWIGKVQPQSLRRLQLAAESMNSCALLLRPDQFASQATPSALRLQIWREKTRPCIQVLKCRGIRPAALQLTQAAA